MRSRVMVIVGASAVMLAAGIGFWWLTSRPSPPPPAVVSTSPPPLPGPASAPPASSSPAPVSAPQPAPPPSTPAPAVEPTTGTLRIRSDVPDTSVFIDRVFLGTAPVTAANLKPGTHHLNMSATGFDAISEDIEVAAGTHDLAKSFKVIVLDATLNVVHKHAFGSCKGALHATPLGITYETTDKGDAFTVALKDLEVFEVDYVNKFLTIKIRKGKSYKFTDPEDNADRLFVFHRDVDKVRQRLLAGT